MFEMRSIPVVTTRKGISAISSRVLNGSGCLAFLLLFLLAAASSASAATTVTPGTVTASPTSPTYGASVTLSTTLTGWASGAGGTVAFQTATASGGTYTTLTGCGTSGAVTAAATTTCATTALPLGTTYLKAVYTTSNSSYTTGGISATAGSVTVTKATPTLTMSPSAATSATYGSAVSLGLTGVPAGATSSDTVVYYYKNYAAVPGTLPTAAAVVSAATSVACTSTPNGALPACSATTLPTGYNYVAAVFSPASGTTDYSAASFTSNLSAAIHVTVATPAITVLASPSSQNYGSPVTLTVSGLPAGAAGSVAFFYGTSSSASSATNSVTCTNSASFTAGAPSCTTSTLPVGTDYVLATVTLTGGTTDYSVATVSNTTLPSVTVAAVTPTIVLTPSNLSPAFGTSVSLAVSGIPSWASGTVVFSYGSTSVTCTTTGTNPVTVSSGAATCATTTVAATALPVGSDVVKAVFSPSPTTGFSTPPFTSNTPTVSVAQASTSVTSLVPSTSTPILGASLTLTANVTTGVAGSVAFTYGASAISATTPVTCSGGTQTVNTGTGVATCITTALPAGANVVLATFTPTLTTDYSGSSNTATVTVLTTTSVGLAITTPVSSPYYYGEALTLTASNLPTGLPQGGNAESVTFYDGGISIGTGTINSSGVATLTTSTVTPLTLGTHTFTVVYGGDSTHAASGVISTIPTSGVTTILANVTTVANHVYQIDTTTPIANSVAYSGTGFTLSATVTASGSVAIPTTSGHVTFYDSSIYLGTGTINSSGIATLDSTAVGFPTSATAAGKHYFIASYGGVYSAVGVAQFSPSLSSSAQLTIVTGQTINFTAPASSPTYNTSVTLVATSVETGTSISTGLTVAFTSATTSVCTVNGTTLSYIGVGTCTVNANQAGNTGSGGIYPAATQVQQTVTVGKAAQSISHWYNGSTIYGAPITLSAVSSSASDSANGLPIVYTVVSGPAAAGVVSGTSVTPTGVGTITISAALAANNYYTGVNAVSRTFTVYPRPLTITATYSGGAIIYGSAAPTTITPTLSPHVDSPASGLATGDTQASLGAGLLCGTSYAGLPSNHPGSYPTFCYGAVNANYDITYVDGSFTVNKATPVFANGPTATGGPYAQLVTFVLSQPAIPATGPFVINGVNNTVAGVWAWTTPSAYASGSGTTPSITFKPSDTQDYNSLLTSTVAITVTKANPTVTWPAAVSISSGTTIASGAPALSGSASNGGVTVGGSFAWSCTVPTSVNYNGGVCATSASPTTLPEWVTFTPGDTADYNSLDHQINVTWTLPLPTVNWSLLSASAITYGSKLSSSQFSITSLLLGPVSTSLHVSHSADPDSGWQGDSGTFTWTSPNTAPAAGNSVSESVTFTPDSGTLSTVKNNINITVNKATPVVSVWPTAAPITYGPAVALSTSTLSFTSGSGGTFAWTDGSQIPDANQNGGAGAASYAVTFTPSGANASNYASITNHLVSVIVNQALATVTNLPTAPAIPVGDTLVDSTPLSGGTASSAGSFAWTDSTIAPAVGNSAQSVTFTPSSTNYTTTTAEVNITVNPCGQQDNGTFSTATGLGNFSYATALSVTNLASSPGSLTSATTPSSTLDAQGSDVSAVCAVDTSAHDGTAVTVTYPTITSESTASTQAIAAGVSGSDAGTYGTNAAVLAFGTVATAPIATVVQGATINITDDGQGDPGLIVTSADYSAGVFATMGGEVNIYNTYVATSGIYSPALKATEQGTLAITDTGTGAGGPLTATTYGNNSPVLATGMGGGIVTSTGGVYTSVSVSSTTGTESAGVHAAGANAVSPYTGSSITLNGDTVTAENASAVEINGKSSVNLTGATLSSANGDNHGIFLYYDSTPGDAVSGASSFTMTGGSILYACDAATLSTCATSAGGYQNSTATVFSVANTATATISLTDVAMSNLTNSTGDGVLLTAAAISGLGTTGSNGATVTFEAYGETLTGDIVVDPISTVNLTLTTDGSAVPTVLTGAINGATSTPGTPGTATGKVNLTLGATSTWIVTEDSYLYGLTNAGSGNIICANPGACHVYVWQTGAWTLQAGIN